MNNVQIEYVDQSEDDSELNAWMCLCVRTHLNICVIVYIYVNEHVRVRVHVCSVGNLQSCGR